MKVLSTIILFNEGEICGSMAPPPGIMTKNANRVKLMLSSGTITPKTFLPISTIRIFFTCWMEKRKVIKQVQEMTPVDKKANPSTKYMYG